MKKELIIIFILLFSCFFIHEIKASTSSDKFKVTGTVVGSSGEPIIGASIVEKGSTNGAMTDVNGRFTIDVSPNSTLVISFIGFHSKEYAISKNDLQLEVVLAEDIKMLNEVVVVGYGVQK